LKGTSALEDIGRLLVARHRGGARIDGYKKPLGRPLVRNSREVPRDQGRRLIQRARRGQRGTKRYNTGLDRYIRRDWTGPVGICCSDREFILGAGGEPSHLVCTLIRADVLGKGNRRTGQRVFRYRRTAIRGWRSPIEDY